MPRDAVFGATQPGAQGVDARNGLGRRFDVRFRLRQNRGLAGLPEPATHRAATTATAAGFAARGDAHIEVRPAVVEVHGTSIH